jgi:hypothetical protein
MSNGSAIGQPRVSRRGLGRNSPQDRHRGPGLTPTVILTKRAPVGTWQGRRPGNGHTGTGGWAREAPAYGWLPRGLRREFRLGENSSPGGDFERTLLGPVAGACAPGSGCLGWVPAGRELAERTADMAPRHGPRSTGTFEPGSGCGGPGATGAARGHIRREC